MNKKLRSTGVEDKQPARIHIERCYSKHEKGNSHASPGSAESPKQDKPKEKHA